MTDPTNSDSPEPDLLGWAIGIISNVDATAAGWPNQTDEWRTAVREWMDAVHDDPATEGPAVTDSIWTYWCPPEGDHIIHRQELQVGIVTRDGDGMGRPLLVAAVVPPALRRHGWSQNESFARLTCDALAAGPWNEPDGFAAGLAADGVHIQFPDRLPASSDRSVPATEGTDRD